MLMTFQSSDLTFTEQVRPSRLGKSAVLVIILGR